MSHDKPCAGCIARDNHIASLKEQLYQMQEFYKNETRVHHDDMNDIIKHVTGMNRIPNQSTDRTLHSVPRNTGLAGRIARAEAADKLEAIPLAAQRKREYEDRIAALMKPETEIVSNAIQESSGKQVQESVRTDILEETS